MQFRPPVEHSKIDAFMRNYLDFILPEEEFLIQITDWSIYTPSEMLTIQALRTLHGDSRPLIDSPGHAITTTEREIGIALFGLSVSYKWCACLYLPRGVAALYNWEGEIFDFWTSDEDSLKKLDSLLRFFKLSTITSAEQDPTE